MMCHCHLPWILTYANLGNSILCTVWYCLTIILWSMLLWVFSINGSGYCDYYLIHSFLEGIQSTTVFTQLCNQKSQNSCFACISWCNDLKPFMFVYDSTKWMLLLSHRLHVHLSIELDAKHEVDMTPFTWQNNNVHNLNNLIGSFCTNVLALEVIHRKIKKLLEKVLSTLQNINHPSPLSTSISLLLF